MEETTNLEIDDDEPITFGGEVDNTKVSLRIFGESLDPDEITQLLKCSPSDSYKKGDRLNSVVITKVGSWHLSTEKSSKSLEHQISDLLSQLNDDLNIWQEITTKYNADLFCGLFLDKENRGTSLSSKILKQVSERGLKIGLDIYC